MKNLLFILIAFVGLSATAQETDYNIKKGYADEGYDVTEYFNNKTVKGDSKYTATYEGAKFKFASQENLDKFNANPKKYAPQYGGYCAYAMALKGEKVDIDPETYEILDGKLYLFYNSWGTNTKKKWDEEGPEDLRKKADKEWESVRTKN